MDQRMPFGMFKGRRLTEVPPEYLRWLARRPDLWAYLREAVEAELRRRQFEGEPGWPPSSSPRPAGATLAERIISAGVRTLARRHHPDVGGDHHEMAAINDAGDTLRQFVRGTLR